MSKQKNTHPSHYLTLSVTSRLSQYLEEIVRMEGFGSTKADVAKRFVWDAINKMLAKGRLKRID